MKKIGIIGGGITGLTAAFQLQQAGLQPLVFETGGSAGGVITTHELDGYRLEAGPNSLLESPIEVSELITALGLEKEVVEASPEAKNRYILRGGRLIPIPMSPPAFLRSPLLSWQGKLRLLKEPFVRKPSGEIEESLATFVRRRLGGEVLDYLVNPFIAGIFAGDPEKLSAQHALPRLFKLEQEHGSLVRGMMASKKKKGKSRLISFRKGLGTVTTELAVRLHQQIYFETTVESITAREGRWELIASRYGRQLRDTYDAVILAVPAAALARINFEKEGEPTGLKDLQDIHYPPVSSVSLGFKREQVAHPLDGFGMLIPEKEQRQILGTLFISTLFPERAPPGHVLLTSFVGGARQPELAREPEEEQRQRVLKELQALLGITGEPVFSSTHLWPHAIPQYQIGHGKFLRVIDNFETAHPGLFIAGPVRDGISLGQSIASGFRHARRLGDFLK